MNKSSGPLTDEGKRVLLLMALAIATAPENTSTTVEPAAEEAGKPQEAGGQFDSA